MQNKRNQIGVFLMKAITMLHIFIISCLPWAETVLATDLIINSSTNGYQRSPSIATNGTNYLVCWNSPHQDGYWNNVYGQFLTKDGIKIDSEFQINSYTPLHQEAPAVASNGMDYLVTWTSGAFGAEPLETGQDGSGDGIYGKFVPQTGTNLGLEFRVNAYTTNHQRFSSVASDGQNYFASWSTLNEDGSTWGISGTKITNNSLTAGSTVINTTTNGIQEYPAVASNGNNYLVAWETTADVGRDLYGRIISKEGIPLGSDIPINTSIPSDQISAEAASDGTNYLVIWQNMNSEQGLLGQLIDSKGILIGDQILISASGSDENSVCSNGSTFLVTWRGVNNLFGQYLGLNGELIGEQFIVNDDTYETVNFSDIASDGENYFVVWEASTTRAADEHYDIYGKILQPIPEPSAMLLFFTGLGWMIFHIKPNHNKR